MNVKKCDRCGKIYHNWEQGSGYLDLHLVGDVDHADLCCECAEALREFIRKQATDKDNLVEKGVIFSQLHGAKQGEDCGLCKWLGQSYYDKPCCYCSIAHDGLEFKPSYFEKRD